VAPAGEVPERAAPAAIRVGGPHESPALISPMMMMPFIGSYRKTNYDIFVSCSSHVEAEAQRQRGVFLVARSLAPRGRRRRRRRRRRVRRVRRVQQQPHVAQRPRHQRNQHHALSCGLLVFREQIVLLVVSGCSFLLWRPLETNKIGAGSDFSDFSDF
jgi:hypothetical protein